MFFREFLYLHNRFTHGILSKYMKGILRPDRRHAMPFGRMDPDVIEGRRKILETYLVVGLLFLMIMNPSSESIYEGIYQKKKNVEPLTNF